MNFHITDVIYHRTSFSEGASMPIEALEKALEYDSCQILDRNNDLVVRRKNNIWYNNIREGSGVKEITYDEALDRLINRLDYLNWRDGKSN